MNTPDDFHNPFPGLRPFSTEDAGLFFGRDAEVKELLFRFDHHRIVLLVGPSGSGRASLVRAGLIPTLQSLDWQIVTARPGPDPIRALAAAVASVHLDIDASAAERALHANSLGLTTLAVRTSAPHLFVVDRLEEIFRLSGWMSDRDDDIGEYLNLLCTAAAHDEPKTRILFILRADFLGECTRWPQLTEAMNGGGLYLLPRLRRDRMKEVIEAPIRSAGAHITPQLVQLVLNDAGGDPDILTLLQHALHETWDVWRRSDSNGPVDVEHYVSAGAINHSLARAADQAIAGLDDRQRHLTKRIFQALVEVDPVPMRRPSTIGEVSSITGASIDELYPIVDHLREPRLPVLWTAPEELTPDTVLDIGHDVILRRWARLGEWIADERRSVERLQALHNWRIYAVRLQSAEIGNFGAWLDRAKPTAAWAGKYGVDLTAATDFLARQKRLMYRDRLVAAVIVLAAVLIFYLS